MTASLPFPMGSWPIHGGFPVEYWIGNEDSTSNAFYEWRKPRGCSFVYLLGIGGGGGGGGGHQAASGNARAGGGGGASGGIGSMIVPAILLPDVLYVQPGAGGVGGSGNGTAGRATSFYIESGAVGNLLTVIGGALGTGATSGSAPAGGAAAANTTTYFNVLGQYATSNSIAGGNGGNGTTPQNGAAGATQVTPISPLGGGGGGGGVSAADATRTGGAGTSVVTAWLPSTPAGAADSSGNPGYSMSLQGLVRRMFISTGGSGGGSSATTAGAGGNGGLGCGGGGGGGGATRGNGGNGGPGLALIAAF